MKDKTKLCVVIPCYNEEEVLEITIKELVNKMNILIKDNKISDKSRIALVDDGSKDRTWSIIESLCDKEVLIDGIKLSRNRGHQNALLAGLMTVKESFDAVVSMDADLQDDINAVDGMLEAFEEGYEVVYGVRSNRQKDTIFKKTTAQAFYKLLKVMGVDIVFNHADYRLLSQRALQGLAEYKEVNLFLRGIVPMVGYKSTEVTYVRNERAAGESKYPLRKMIEFALEGITSCSVKPLRLIAVTGFMIFALSILYSVYVLIVHFMGETVEGWTTIALSIWLLGGLQIFSIGMVGEYIGKIYLEAKARPKYFVAEYISDNQE